MNRITSKKLRSIDLKRKVDLKMYSVIFLLMSSFNIKAQNLSDTTSFLNKTEFKIGYQGNLFWDNGLNLGAEYLWKEKVKLKERRKGQKRITRQFLFQGTMGYSTNFSNETDNGLSTFYGIIWRRKNHKGKQLSLEISPLGYYRSFLPETYEVKGDDVKRIRFPGRSYYSPSFAIGFGKQREGKTRSGRYFNLRWSIRAPYNSDVLPVLSFEYGHRFSFKKR